MPTSNSAWRASQTPSPATNILLFLVAFRLLNAFAVRTFFQPDEFFQSLEPAWQIAFGHGEGKGTGAWITWEWNHQLRSSLHPLLFAGIFKIVAFLTSALHLSDATRAELLIAGPKTAQAVVSAIGDFYTWKLATRIYGEDSRGAWTTVCLKYSGQYFAARGQQNIDWPVQLIVTILNPWQWFCSTRTLSNCLETTITIVALDLWPWQWSAGIVSDDSRKNFENGRGKAEDRRLVSSLRWCLCLAALACILRPTNVLIWATLAIVAWVRTTWTQRRILVCEVLVCGSAIIIVSAVADRLFYGFWTFPPLRFLYFNIAQSLAVFYGRNDWHYYASQGYPLLLTTVLPFALVGLYRTLKNNTFTAADQVQTAIRVQLATVCLVMPFVLSLISHKEVRFIYPLLPALHILAAPPLVQFFYPAISSRSSHHTPRRLTLIFLILVNVVIALYTTLYHASGILNVLTYLRHQHEIHSPDTKQPSLSPSIGTPEHGITAGFLMPCHSTPWRSHLIYPTINAWALSCEPPIDFTPDQKATYRDEADQFYDDPATFLRTNMAGGLRHLPRRPTYASGPRSFTTRSSTSQTTYTHDWPDYLIFFAQLEQTLAPLLRGSSYGECWRTWNTAWHDDWRRTGDIVVWCLDMAEQDTWRAEKHRQIQEHRDRKFDSIVEAIKKEARERQKRGWRDYLPTSSSVSFPWSPSTSSLTWWRRSMMELSFPRFHFSWPWGARSRTHALWDNTRRLFGHQSRGMEGWIPSLPSWPDLPPWLGGKSKSKRVLDRDLWS